MLKAKEERRSSQLHRMRRVLFMGGAGITYDPGQNGTNSISLVLGLQSQPRNRAKEKNPEVCEGILSYNKRAT